ncbi:MAG: hypothetical protein ACOXZV_00755 [Bacteroidales bacterium]|jgi:hypothetical protein
MKRIINLLLILAFLGLSGCWTKIYLSEQEREQESILKDDEPPLLKAIKPTIISPGGTWGTVRSIINTNFSNIDGTLDSIEHNIDVHDDSLTAHRIAINLRLLKSDTADMLQRYVRQSALNTALAGKQNTLVPGVNIKTINNQSPLGSGNIEITGGGGSMIYPSGSGIVTANNGAWGTTITNNSANWNTAYSERLRWDGGSTGLNAATGRTSLGLNNVTNESKATMFTNPQFTGTAVRWDTDTLATRAEVRVGRGLTAQQVGEQIGDSIRTGVQLGDVALLLSDTSRMLAPYARRSELGSSGVSEATVRQIVGDTIAERLRTAVPGLRLQDSSGYAPGNYMTRAGTTALVNTREADLGNPSTSGYILSSTAAGVRSWIAPASGGGMVYPSGSGIPIVNNGAWGTTITNNSTNWNTAYGWGNHASAGYFVGTNATIRQLFSESVTGLTYTDSTGVLSLTSGYLIPTTTQASAWNDAATNFRSATQVATQIGDSLRAARNKDSDTGPLFIFGLGSGHISDTALFNNGRIAGAFYHPGPDTLYVTEVRGVLTEGTGTETITCDVVWDVNMRDATPTHLVATGLTVTSTTTGTVLTSFSNNMILPNRWVWCPLSGASANNKPTMLILQLTGYKRNRSN